MRPNYYVGLLDFLPKAIEYELCKLFVKEIAFHAKIEKLKQELVSKADFDPRSGFKAIDDWNYNYIDFANLKRFLKSTGYIATNKELAAVIRRLDLNADSRLSLEEFEEGTKPIEPYSKVTTRSLVKTKSRPKTAKLRSSTRSKSITKKKKGTKKFKRGGHTLKGSSVTGHQSTEHLDYSPKKLSSFKNELSESKEPEYVNQKKRIDQYQSPEGNRSHYGINPYQKPVSYNESTENRAEYISPQRAYTSHSPPRTREYSTCSPRNPAENIPEYGHTLAHTDEKELVSTLKDLLEMEEDLENYKIDLSLKPDFNLVDLFRMFDTINKGYITLDEFRSGLYLFHIYASQEEALLLFTRYETVNKGTLNYSDFCDIFSPKDEEYSSSLRVRPSYYIHKPYYKITEYFHPETRLAVENLLNTNLRVEACADTMRDHLSLLPSFNAMEAFNTIDMKNLGYLDAKQFKLLLEAHGVYNKNCEYLVDRFDKTKDGKVTYVEFADGLRKY